MSDIYLYAEILANIKQVSLYASLQTTKNEKTKIDVSSDRRVVTVLHDGQSANIFLPTGIAGSAEVTIPAEKKKEVSVRLEIEDLAGLSSANDCQSQNDYPWLAEDLSVETVIRCANCEATLIDQGTITTWKDLPSEGWAEMMDLWHCHKPHGRGPETKESAVAGRKGYSASSRLIATEGTGLIDVSTFLLAREDCRHIQLKSSTLDNNRKKLRCTQCSGLLGFEGTTVSGWRIDKSKLAVKPNGQTAWQVYPAEVFVCSQLLALIEAQAVRRFVLHSGLNARARGLLIWVFNPDLMYSSSKSTPTTHRAMKIFYQDIDNAQKILDEQNSTVEELYLPRMTLQTFSTALEQSTKLLPVSARSFKEWSVGLLDRYQRHSPDVKKLNENFKPLFT